MLVEIQTLVTVDSDGVGVLEVGGKVPVLVAEQGDPANTRINVVPNVVFLQYLGGSVEYGM